MTLFTLLIVLALDRVVSKPNNIDISKLSKPFFDFCHARLSRLNIDSARTVEVLSLIVCVLLPSLLCWLLIDNLHGFFVFLLNIAGLWAFVGNSNARATYKQYIAAAKRNDQATCEQLGQSLGSQKCDAQSLANQFLLANYYYYAAVILFFVVLGLPGVFLYGLAQEYLNRQPSEDTVDETEKDDEQSEKPQTLASGLVFVLNWIPSRISALGYLLVGHFSKGFPVWLAVSSKPNSPTEHVLTEVAQASEEVNSSNHEYLQVVLQTVRLAKRNTVFILICVSVLTLVGVVQ